MNLRQWIDTCKPAVLLTIGDEWLATASGLETLFQDYVDAVTKVNGDFWEGQCADTAQARALADQRTMQTLADKLEAIAHRAKAGYDEVDAPLQRARTALAESVRRCYRIDDNTLALTHPSKSATTEDARALLDLQAELNNAVQSTLQADIKIRDELNATRDDLRASFVSTAALGADQGRADGDDLAANPGQMTPEQTQRLIEAGGLTPEQLTALESGNTATIPASQMEYLTQVSQSLDGKSPQEIQQIMNKLPPDTQRALSNSMQLVSNPNIAAGPVASGDKDLRNNGRGGFSQLPKQIQDSLSRDDLVVKSFQMHGREMHNSIALNGVADNQAIANIVQAGDSQYRNGTDLDRNLLDVGRQYLNAQVTHEQDPNKAFVAFTVDGPGEPSTAALTESIFSATGQDKAAVESLVTGENGKQFVTDALSHQWSDDGKAVSSVFSFGEKDATVEDPTNQQDVQTAERTGRIMQVVGEATSTDQAWKNLSNIPGTDSQSAGQVNPELLQTMSRSMSPYISELAGFNDEHVMPGFNAVGSDGKSWISPENNNYSGSANVFALMNTDIDAGRQFNAAATAAILNAEGRFADNPTGPNNREYLTGAGTLHGLVDKGLWLETNEEIADKNTAAEEAYKRKEDAYGLVGDLAGQIPGPGGQFADWATKLGGDPLKEAIIGSAPVPESERGLQGVDFYRDAHFILQWRQAQHGLPAEFIEDYGWAFDDNGRMLSYDEVMKHAGNNQQSLTAYETMINSISGKEVPNAMRNGYGDVVLSNG